MSGGNIGTMNGKPCWSPPARTKCYEFGGQREDEPISLADIPAIVRKGIRDGLIIMPAPEPKNALPKIGNGSVWSRCTGCDEMFPRAKKSDQPKCKVCRLERKTCKVCSIEFQPQQRKQVVCSITCRNYISKAAAMTRASRVVDTTCAGCGKVFQQKDSVRRWKNNCSTQCGLVSMLQNRKAKN